MSEMEKLMDTDQYEFTKTKGYQDALAEGQRAVDQAGLVDHGAPQISLAETEFLEAAKRWQEQAAFATAQAAKYAGLARVMSVVYRDALSRSMELGD